MRWRIFTELYLKILLSVLAVVSVMLLLEGGLNQLKLRALVAEATSSRHQISASTIEASVVQAEGLGFAIDQMTGLQDLIDRQRDQDPSVSHIAIVSPIGDMLLSSGAIVMSDGELDRVLRRVLGSQEKTTRFDAGERLYTGRLLYDSTDAIMGAIIMVAPSELYMASAQQSFAEMRLLYVMIFGLCAVLLLPLVIVQFAGVRHAFRVLDPRALDEHGQALIAVASPDAVELKAKVAQGAAKIAELEGELAQLATVEPQDVRAAS